MSSPLASFRLSVCCAEHTRLFASSMVNYLAPMAAGAFLANTAASYIQRTHYPDLPRNAREHTTAKIAAYAVNAFLLLTLTVYISASAVSLSYLALKYIPEMNFVTFTAIPLLIAGILVYRRARAEIEESSL